MTTAFYTVFFVTYISIGEATVFPLIVPYSRKFITVACSTTNEEINPTFRCFGALVEFRNIFDA